MTHDQVPEPLGTVTARRASRWVAIRAAGGRWLVWLLRLLVWAVLVGAALLLIRQVTAPSADAVVDAALEERLAGDERTWPTDRARDAAARVVLEAYTYDDAVENSEDVSGPAVRPGSGIGEVTQQVEAITPGRVEVHDASRATVHLAARLATTTIETDEDGDEDTTVRRRWRWLAVPVAYHHGVVTASPDLIETPPPTQREVTGPEVGEVDASWSDDTRELGEAIFAALAGESQAALDALTDGSIARLADDVELVEVERWQVATPERRGVQTGTPAQLTAHAHVVWAYDTGLTSTQTYTVELKAASGGRWLATELGPAHPTTRPH